MVYSLTAEDPAAGSTHLPLQSSIDRRSDKGRRQAHPDMSHM